MEKRLFVAEENYKRLDLFLSEQAEDLTRSRIQKLVESGAVFKNGERAKKSGEEIRVGDRVLLELPEPCEYAVKAENIPIDVVYQDQDFAVVNKRQGMVVHIGNGVMEGTLVNALLYALDNLSGIGGVMRPGIVHRIDKDTSGLLVVAKNDKAHLSLAGQIAEKTCKRVYYALLEGNLKTDEGRVETDIGRHPVDRVKMAVLPSGKGKHAVTDYKVVERYGNEFTLCEFSLQTGRTHQIRVHAAHLGHPVVGDPTYGYKKQKYRLDGQLLHAAKLVLTHPSTGERMEFTAPLPDYFEEIVQKLRKQYPAEK
ncbi:MAG: RluA family pseudouridine synthase [Clostridia bacterium]|nr:RluA family pseudouridine synthase [Clostridia bacterium]